MNLPVISFVSVRDKAFLSRQLATMMSSGIPLAQSIGVLTLETTNPQIREALSQIVHDLEAGLPFSAAIEKHPSIFNTTYVAAARAGEASGKLEDVLLDLANHIEQESAVISKVKSAMIYPAFIVVAMIAVIVLMMIRVLPQLKTIFTESGVELPASTRFLMASSDFLVAYWIPVLVFLVGLGLLLRYYLKTPTGIYLLNHFQAHLPGHFSDALYMSRFTRTMSMLVRSGIPIMQALSVTSEVMNNVHYRSALLAARSQVERGIPLSSPLSQNRLFPRIVSQMIMVGEQTGKLDQLLEKLAKYYEDEIDVRIKNLSSLIEPIIIVILGLGVAFLVVSILMPIYDIAQVQ